MQKLSFLAPAKVNLFLRILNKTIDGYHNMQSMIVLIDLYDTLIFSKNNLNSSKLKLSSPQPIEDNIVGKIVDYVKINFNIKENLLIELEKNIPIGAGLGGGSSDAATTLMALNKIYNLNLPLHVLEKMAIKFGADIPLFIKKQHVIIESIGDTTKTINIPVSLPILLIHPNISLSTKKVFNNYIQQDKQPIKIDTKIYYNAKEFISFIKKQDNDLTSSAIYFCSEIKDILELLNITNPILSRMTGSGSACFAIYNDNEKLEQAYYKIKNSPIKNYFIKKVYSI